MIYSCLWCKGVTTRRGVPSLPVIVKQINSKCRINQAINGADLGGICHPTKRFIPVHLQTRTEQPNTIKTQFFQAACCAMRLNPGAEGSIHPSSRRLERKGFEMSKAK